MHNLQFHIDDKEMTDGNNEGNNKNSSQNNSSTQPWSPSPSSMSFTPTTLHTIAVVEEKPSISKQSVSSDTIIEKRWVTKTEIVRVPVTYEEIYVNGKPMSSGGGGILSDLKKAFSGKNDTAKKSGDMEPKGNFVPLSTGEVEKVIPVFGEKIIITTKMTKLNDLVIRKRRIVENKKIRVNVTRESVKIKHPNGKIEDLST
jgi:stress response protein YsnF